MYGQRRHRHGVITRSATGPGAAEAFTIIAIATVLITRLYLALTGYPQVGGGDLHIAHALYGGALMMLALLIGWLMLGFGARAACVILGGIGFGLFLDEVGKFVTKNNDYFYGPAAEIMYILVVVVLVGARIVRDFRPLSARECLASAAMVAADGVARGLAARRREIGLGLAERAGAGGADADEVAAVRALLLSADPASDRLHALQERAIRLVPDFLHSPRWVPILGCLIVVGAFLSVVFGALGVALGRDEHLVGHPADQRGSDARYGAAGDDRAAPLRQRVAVGLAAQRGAGVHAAQRVGRLRHGRLRRVAQHVDRPVHAGDHVLSARPRREGRRPSGGVGYSAVR
jgi:hypothetical protein